MTELRNFFESYGIDFADDLDECVKAYNDQTILLKYFRLRFLKENKIAQPNLIDIIVDNVRMCNKKYKNWIIVNAPLDFLLVQKLIDSDLHPIQMVFFCDTDPMHKILLNDETLYRNRDKIIQEILENVKNGTRYETLTERVNYAEFISQIENIAQNPEYEEFLPEEFEIGVYGNRSIIATENNFISHDYIMEIIVPEIIERLNEYTDDLFRQWNTLKNLYLKKTDRYVDFNIIECKPGHTANMFSVLIEDTLYYIKK